MQRFDVPLVMYHSINDYPQDNPLGFLSLSSNQLAEHLRFLKDDGYELVTLSELLQKALLGQVGQSLIAALTFDDGFLDSYLVAAEILKRFGARGTIFVNPAHASHSAARTLKQVPHAWGFLNFDEMRLLEKTGIFEIQSHTMSHDSIFVSDELVDLYTPDQFKKYYWLVWMLYPHTRLEWHGDVERFAGLVPSGYPIFKPGRSLESPRFVPSSEFIECCIQFFARSGISCLADLRSHALKGEFEAESSYIDRIDYQLKGSKSVLETELSKTVECICFPGNKYSDRLLAHAAQMGYKLYMAAAKENAGENITILHNAPQLLSDGQMVGLKRVSMNSEFPRFFPPKIAAYWTMKLKMGDLNGHSIYSRIADFGRELKQIPRKNP